MSSGGAPKNTLATIPTQTFQLDDAAALPESLLLPETNDETS